MNCWKGIALLRLRVNKNRRLQVRLQSNSQRWIVGLKPDLQKIYHFLQGWMEDSAIHLLRLLADGASAYPSC